MTDMVFADVSLTRFVNYNKVEYTNIIITIYFYLIRILIVIYWVKYLFSSIFFFIITIYCLPIFLDIIFRKILH